MQKLSVAEGPSYKDTFKPASGDDLVSFSIICTPRSRATFKRLRDDLSRETLRRYLPTDALREHVESQLRDLGFEVFPGPGAVVSARGTVRRFHSVFGGRLERRVRHVTSGAGKYTDVAIVQRPGAKALSARRIEGALRVVVIDAPVLLTPLVPPSGSTGLRLPGDIALLTGASATHRQRVASGDRASGGQVVVAVIDSGFADHPYLIEHGYRIVRVSASDQNAPPNQDPSSHGTFVLACLLACAPDAQAYAVRFGPSPVVALTDALNIPGVRVVSISWGWDLGKKSTLSADLVAVQMQILKLVEAGVVVVAAAGNGWPQTFPATMPEVIAVGGVTVNPDDTLSVWPLSSSFAGPTFPNRRVPDLCGIASQMALPVPGPPLGWQSHDAGTSGATPQIAAVAALLIQKDPALTWDAVLKALIDTATDVTKGTSSSGMNAGVGPDLASGAGFVNALHAWSSI